MNQTFKGSQKMQSEEDLMVVRRGLQIERYLRHEDKNLHLHTKKAMLP